MTCRIRSRHRASGIHPALRPRLVAGFVSILLAAALQPANAQDFVGFDRMRLVDDRFGRQADRERALFLSTETGGALVRSGDGFAVLPPPEVDGYRLTDIFSILPTVYVRVGAVPADRATLIELFRIERAEGAGPEWRVERIGSDIIGDLLPGSAFLEGLQVFVADAEWPVMAEVQLCQMGLMQAMGLPNCQQVMGRPFERRVEIPLGPASDFVVDANSEFIVSLHPFDGSLAISDARYGKVFDTMFFKSGLDRASIESAEEQVGPRAYRMSVFVGFPGDGAVELIDIDADFRQPRPVNRLFLDELLEVPPPFTVRLGGSGPEREIPGRDIVARVASSSDQSVILVGGYDNVVHALARNSGRSGVLFRRLFDVRSEAGPVVDFDVSADGSRLGLLLADGPRVIETAALLTEDRRAREAYLAELGASPVGPGGEAGREADLAIAIQQRLTEEGFYRGIDRGLADGLFSPEMRAALGRFAERNGLPELAGDIPERPSAVDPTLLVRLFAHRISEFPRGALDAEAQARLFDRFFEEHLADIRYFAPSEIYTLGRADRSDCAGLNAYPSPDIWPNILRPVRALDELRAMLGRAVVVRSSFQTPDYAECARTSPSAPQMPDALQSFRGLRFSSAADRERIVRGLEELAQAGRLEWSGDRTDPDVFYLAAPEVPRDLPERIGRWHVQVAAYTADTRGCGEAIEDVAEIGDLMAGTALSGSYLYVARRDAGGRPDGQLLVTIDTGEREDLARESVRLVRAMSRSTSDGRTGRDAYASEASSLRFDLGCLSSIRIP